MGYMSFNPLIKWTPEDIKAARKSLGLNQTDFAVELGTSQQRISMWEGGITPKNAWQRVLTIFLAEKGINNVKKAE
tara:strand:+ start:1640 stop:1867 length:228 start_codon:yes stop_codon:yes gene_type:complete